MMLENCRMSEWFFVLWAAFLAWLGGMAVIRLAPKLGLIDRPNERSSHRDPTPRAGGLGFVVGGSLCGLAVIRGDAALQGILAWGAGLALTGLVDDILSLPRWLRLLIQFVALMGLLFVAGYLPPQSLLPEWGMFALLVIAGLWWINLFNFMDGIDGIAGVESLSILLLSMLLLLWGQFPVMETVLWWLMLILAGGVSGFLVLNWPPARVFMGDVGSTWLAYMLFAIAVLTIQREWLSVSVWVILGGLFIVDASVTLLVRIVKRERWYQAHRSHAYQKASQKIEQAVLSMGIASNPRSFAQRRVILSVLAVNVFWLGPLAFAAHAWPEGAGRFVLLAYFPLLIVALYYRAGRSYRA